MTGVSIGATTLVSWHRQTLSRMKPGTGVMAPTDIEHDDSMMTHCPPLMTREGLMGELSKRPLEERVGSRYTCRTPADTHVLAYVLCICQYARHVDTTGPTRGGRSPTAGALRHFPSTCTHFPPQPALAAVFSGMRHDSSPSLTGEFPPQAARAAPPYPWNP
jgi:hypothetical protein